ncbi:DUF3253 domain-containing protein [Methylopila turkensis]|uniref:DUF3253 domain-containing protein n=1 Tax=Methylopila turkensis TaxID=1437816 RepID=A0A9W6JMC7_9HYPH|nr:DUF3253 domain-containing protein [Methylopila turkensis]GLK78334.1 hypothetical protein GCM10008174_00750 [Methylopila turkensis]
MTRSTDSILEAIRRLVAERGPGKTICPTEAAKASAKADGLEGDAWQGRIKAVRAAAVGLARAGEVAIYRKGKPVDPDDFKGVYRIGLPAEDTIDPSSRPEPQAESRDRDPDEAP